VREVLSYAREYERVPANLVNSLTQLAEGSTFPVAGGSVAGEGVAAEAGSPVLAVVDGTVGSVGHSSSLGTYLVLRDAYGDRFVYSQLGRVEVREGDSVTAGERLAAVGGSARIGFSAQPDGSTEFDASTLLAIWRKGGAGRIYGVDESGSSSEAAAATRALLMSGVALRRSVLAEKGLTLPACERAAIRSGSVARQALSALAYLAKGDEVTVADSSCEGSGFAVEIETGDAQSLPRAVVAALESGGATIDAGGKTIEVDYTPPRQARLVDGKAIAPVDAPAAVQAMIAAANQISDTPYVWGGGHGSWVSAGYDCSGSVSYVLHAAELLSTPLTSGALASWGESGSGRWVTVYANGEHTYAVIAGLRWDTVGDTSGSGPRWHESPAYPSGFAVRHPRGL